MESSLARPRPPPEWQPPLREVTNNSPLGWGHPLSLHRTLHPPRATATQGQACPRPQAAGSGSGSPGREGGEQALTCPCALGAGVPGVGGGACCWGTMREGSADPAPQAPAPHLPPVPLAHPQEGPPARLGGEGGNCGRWGRGRPRGEMGFLSCDLPCAVTVPPGVKGAGLPPGARGPGVLGGGRGRTAAPVAAPFGPVPWTVATPPPLGSEPQIEDRGGSPHSQIRVLQGTGCWGQGRLPRGSQRTETGWPRGRRAAQAPSPASALRVPSPHLAVGPRPGPRVALGGG